MDTRNCILTMMNENDPTVPNTKDTQMKDSGVTSVAISPIDGLCVAAVIIIYIYIYIYIYYKINIQKYNRNLKMEIY